MFHVSDAFNSTILSLPANQLKTLLLSHYEVNETAYVIELIDLYKQVDEDNGSAVMIGQTIVNHIRQSSADREGSTSGSAIDNILQEYNLSSQEGVLLMKLAEALLRVPDAETADQLIAEIMQNGDWLNHLFHTDALEVNTSTLGLLMTQQWLSEDENTSELGANLHHLLNKLSAPVIRTLMKAVMNAIGNHFVAGTTISEAMAHAVNDQVDGFVHAYDMLGESAITDDDAEQYLARYEQAIRQISDADFQTNDRGSISVKLSALYPRYEESKRDLVMNVLLERLTQLLMLAHQKQVKITIDAEEMDRLELSLDLIENLLQLPFMQGWDGLGLAVQAYSKSALPLLVWLAALAKEQDTLISVRLVKGAYWDAEIKSAQQQGLADYPVFTRKSSTDLSYLCCAQFLLSDWGQAYLRPQFATHNAFTLASVYQMALSEEQVLMKTMEFQRLQGMGEAVYQTFIDYCAERSLPRPSVRIYSPVGDHAQLLPYLVRRLLENGANASFVHEMQNPDISLSALSESPCHKLEQAINAAAPDALSHQSIPLPIDVFGDVRSNSTGIALHQSVVRNLFFDELKTLVSKQWLAESIVGETPNLATRTYFHSSRVVSPYDLDYQVGEVHWSSSNEIEQALSTATEYFSTWRDVDVDVRVAALERMADLLETNLAQWVSLCCREAGKTFQDGIDEVREAADFCRYYAYQARHQIKGEHLKGITGESNYLSYQGKGVFVCISPWNFPLAIFVGQVAAALVTGNTVVAKPAEQTSLIAYEAVKCFHDAGVPRSALQFVTGHAQVGQQLVSDLSIAGVVFTGSTETAMSINRTLAARDAPIATLIAETGGQNAMIVDSTALPEQVVKDVMNAAFNSAGQRCSALRVLYLQEECEVEVVRLLKGAMQEWTVGSPSKWETDTGPVIDKTSQQSLQMHIDRLSQQSEIVAIASAPEVSSSGYFIRPIIFKIKSIHEISGEQFGPVLHVISYKKAQLDAVIDDINSTGFGLTFSLHSRLNYAIENIAHKVNAGNIYINRDQVGATVGVQPFGGMGWSGTGPKAGGPNYLRRFMCEKLVTVNTSAAGGDVDLLSGETT